MRSSRVGNIAYWQPSWNAAGASGDVEGRWPLWHDGWAGFIEAKRARPDLHRHAAVDQKK
jgi:hypothetical protein